MKILVTLLLLVTLILGASLLAMCRKSKIPSIDQNNSSFIASDEFYHRDDKDIAKIILLRCNAVTTNKIYEGGTFSPCSWAITVLYEDAKKNGINILISIFNEAKNDTAKIYVIFAMYHLNKEKFEVLNKKIGNPYVKFIDYCIISKITYSELFEKYSKEEAFASKLLLNPIPSFEKILEMNSLLRVP